MIAQRWCLLKTQEHSCLLTYYRFTSINWTIIKLIPNIFLHHSSSVKKVQEWGFVYLHFYIIPTYAVTK